MSPADLDIDVRNLERHEREKSRLYWVTRWACYWAVRVVAFVLIVAAILAVGALTGHLMEVLAPVEPWSPPNTTTTRFP